MNYESLKSNLCVCLFGVKNFNFEYMLAFGIGSQLTEVDDSTYFFEVWLIVFGLMGLKW